MRVRSGWLVLGALFLVSALPSKAAIVQTFTDRVAWEAAVVSFLIENLNAVPLGVVPLGTTALGIVDFTYTEPVSVALAPEIYEPGSVNGTRALEVTVGDDSVGFGPLPSFATITLPGFATAFGANFESSTSAAILGISITGGSVSVGDHLPSPGTGFFGFISDVLFQDVVFTAVSPIPSNPGEIFTIDNLSFNQVAAVPEPSTFAMFAGGALLIAFARRRRSK